MPVYVTTASSGTNSATMGAWNSTNVGTSIATTTTNTIYWSDVGNTPTLGNVVYWSTELDEVAALTAQRRVPSYADMDRRQREARMYAIRQREIRAYQEEALRQAERRQAAQLKHDKAARDRAHALLLEHLTPKQRQTFEDNDWFIVEGGKSKTQYRVRGKGSLVANIDVMEKGKVKHRLCGHCDPGAIPLGDHLLAQKMMLEYAEDDFLRIANRHAA